ncbi:MAG: hypothetical protein JWO86_3848 [Myxococcaceae bacterium]|nr:hypothetical protein [Myxococcaceae bacterium]
MPAPSSLTTTVEGLLRLAGSAGDLREICPVLALSDDADARADGSPIGPASFMTDDANESLARDGLAVLVGTGARETCANLVRAIDALHDSALPAVFVYAFDEPWALGEHARACVTGRLARDYVLVEDVWAWRVARGSDGWPPHRGIEDVVLDRDAPEILNVWIALSDAATDRACMHIIPLGDDPGYPARLRSVDARPEAVRAVPARAGDALFWNANVLHWGGRCEADAVGPRVSCSFTLCRKDAFRRFPHLIPLDLTATLDLRARTDLIAHMVVLYGGADRGDVSPVLREWAALTHELASRFGRTAGPSVSLRKAP